MESEKTICYPIRQKIISSNESCSVVWELLEPVGEVGNYGEIWSVCCGTDCNHVLKYLPYKENKKDAILNEINIQNECAFLGLCPKIQDAWLCDKGGAIVMEIYELTVKQLLLKYKTLIVRNKILAHILALVDKLHLNGIYHGDLHLDNIMVKSTKKIVGNYNKNVLFELKNYKYHFIDFGKGGRFYTMSNFHVEDDYIEIAAHLQDLIDEYPDDKGFNDLYQIMKIHMSKFE